MSHIQEQRKIAARLDEAAHRCDYVGGIPASRKQCWYLAYLMVQAGDDGSEFLDSNIMLSKRDASDLIAIELKAAA